jgi:rare lipoprotein A
MKQGIPKMIATILQAILAGCTAAYLGPASSPGDVNEGQAAYYADSLQGNRTASGERYDKNQLTAAHRTLPFGTVVRVTSLVNRRSVEVKINDRGPFSHKERIVDLSRKAAERLDMIAAGVIPARVEIVSMPNRQAPSAADKKTD